MELGEHFWKYVNKTETCWNWTGSKTRGYGHYSLSGKQYRTHRLMWEVVNGAIPDGMVICHKCDNPSCVNPDHLFIGTQADNIADCIAKGRSSKYMHKGVGAGEPKPPYAIGEHKPNAKLTENDVREIKRLWSNGLKMPIIAKQFGVNRSAVRQIIKGITWKHVI